MRSCKLRAARRRQQRHREAWLDILNCFQALGCSLVRSDVRMAGVLGATTISVELTHITYNLPRALAATELILASSVLLQSSAIGTFAASFASLSSLQQADKEGQRHQVASRGGERVGKGDWLERVHGWCVLLRVEGMLGLDIFGCAPLKERTS